MLVAVPCLAQDGFEGGRPIGNWSVYCKASGDCTAELFQVDGGDSTNLLTIIRRVDDAGWTVGLLTSLARPNLSAGVSFVVDGTNVGHVDDNALCVRDFPPGKFLYAHHLYLTGVRAAEVFTALLSGEAARLQFAGANGTADMAEFALAGMSLSLGWIERRQGRPDETWSVSLMPESITNSEDVGAIVPSDC